MGMEHRRQACGEMHPARYEAQDGHFRIWCAFCGRSTERYADMSLARLEWIGSQPIRRA